MCLWNIHRYFHIAYHYRRPSSSSSLSPTSLSVWQNGWRFHSFFVLFFASCAYVLCLFTVWMEMNISFVLLNLHAQQAHNTHKVNITHFGFFFIYNCSFPLRVLLYAPMWVELEISSRHKRSEICKMKNHTQFTTPDNLHRHSFIYTNVVSWICEQLMRHTLYSKQTQLHCISHQEIVSYTSFTLQKLYE